MKALGILPTLGLFASLGALFVAERIFGEGTARSVAATLGGLGVATSIAARTLLLSRSEGARRAIEGRILGAYFGVAFSLLLYVVSTAEGLAALGFEGAASDMPAAIFGVLWPSSMAVSAAALLWMETAWQTLAAAHKAEVRRVQSAAYAGISLAFALIFVVSVNYAAGVRDTRRDLSYFRTTHPSAGTERMVSTLAEPVEVVLFYPRVNEVLGEVEPYFERLTEQSSRFTVTRLDHALAPALAREHRVRGNGFVLLLEGEGDAREAEAFEVGMELEVARSRLRTLDERFQEAFARLIRQQKELHVTAGHDEHSATGIEGDGPDARITQLNDALRQGNVSVRPLGMAQGLANRVPEGAPAVAVFGPRSPFLPEEAAALLAYVQQGGRLLLLLDPDVDHGLDSLLEGLGLRIEPGVLASERQHLRRRHNESDRGLVYTNRYSSHPTVSTASRYSSRLATVVVGGGNIQRAEVPQGTSVVFPVRVGRVVWRDLDGDFTRDEDEPLEDANLMAAVSVNHPGGEEGRAVVIADGDFLTDQVITNAGNSLVFSDIVQWLIGQEQIVGSTESEEDRLLEHTRDEDQILFYATSFAAPLPFLGLGIFVALRRYGGRKKPRAARHGVGGDEVKERDEEPDEVDDDDEAEVES